MKISIQALELAMTPEELTKSISEEKLKQIKGKGVLQAYTLAHEGKSQPKVLGDEPQLLKWTRAVIHRLAEKIKTGTKFFIGHGAETNDHEGRKTVGEVLTSFVKEIGGKLATVIVGHFPNKEIVDPYDICSMEADIQTEDDIVGDINDVSGIALGNSHKDSPAFPGALRLSTVQCFGETTIKPGEGEKEVALTFEEVKAAVRSMNIYPRQLFTEDDLKQDRTFGKVFESNETLKAENERLLKDNTEIAAKSKEAIRKTAISDSEASLNKLMEEGYTDKQKSYIKTQFDPEKVEDLSDDGLKKFLEESKVKFAETAKLFGVTDSVKPKSETSTTEDGKDMEEQALELIGAVSSNKS